MTNYYYVTSALPPLQIGTPPELSFTALDHLLVENLSEADYEKVVTLRRYHDLQNLRHLWREEEFEPHGNLSDKQMEEAILTQTRFPDYVFDFLEQYDNVEQRLRYLPRLTTKYFQKEIERSEGFIQDYLTLEREMRLVFVGFRCKQLERDLAQELQWEDPHDDLVVQLMAQKDAKSYEPPTRYEGLKGIFEMHKEKPYELHKALNEFRFDKVTSLCAFEPFALDWVLAYVVQLILVERWMELDRQQGQQVVESVVALAGT